MKIKLSTYWWRNLYVSIAACILILIIDLHYLKRAVQYQLFDGEDGFILKLVLCIVPLIFVCVFLDVGILQPRKFLRVINVDDKMFTSTFFGRQKCEVNRHKQIYYAIFDCKESNFGGEKNSLQYQMKSLYMRCENLTGVLRIDSSTTMILQNKLSSHITKKLKG